MKSSQPKATVNAAGKLKRKSQFRNDLDAWVLILPSLIVLYLFVWRPTVLGAVWSFFKMNSYTPAGFVGLDNYRKVIMHTQFLPMLWNTVEYVFWSVVFGYLPPLIVAVMLNEMVHFKSGFRITIYLPAIIPGIVAMLMWFNIFSPEQTGLLNMLLTKVGLPTFNWLNNPNFAIPGIVIYMTWKGFPGTMLLYYAAVQGTSVELYEAALIDGAGPFKRAWHVTRPAIEGLLILNIVNQISSVFQVMQEPMTMTGGGPNGASMSLGYQLYLYGFKSSGRGIGQAMALGVIIFLILIVITIFYFWLNKRVEDRY